MPRNVFGLFALLGGMALAGGAGGQEPPTDVWTAITVPEMHCANCAKKVCVEIGKQTGMAKTQTDMKTKTIYVLAKDKEVLSPKSLWEAVEQADETPTKLVGPSGTFTAKPKSRRAGGVATAPPRPVRRRTPHGGACRAIERTGLNPRGRRLTRARER